MWRFYRVRGRGAPQRTAVVLAGVMQPLVAVRSSATAEDLPEASFVGMNETFLNVCGEKGAAGSAAGLLGTLYGAQGIFYRM